MPSRAINPNRPCQTIADFLTAVRAIRKDWRKGAVDSKGDSRPLWFRGQRSAKWTLQPRLYRDEYRAASESEIRLEFEGNGLQLITTNPDRSKWEWYFLMQHYGAPTRLMDWTANPLAALYFAVSDERDDLRKQNAAVWVIDPWRWNKLHGDGLRGPALPGWGETKPYLPDLEDACDGVTVNKPAPLAIEPPTIDRRLASQTARFLLFGKKKDLTKIADRDDLERNGGKGSRLRQILIGAGKVDDIRLELDDLGINHRTLFPDLEGLGAHLSWEWKGFRKRTRLY